MKHHIGLTIDAKLLKQIETIRGREKRSTFIEHLIKLGLKTYTHENNKTLNKENYIERSRLPSNVSNSN